MCHTVGWQGLHMCHTVSRRVLLTVGDGGQILKIEKSPRRSKNLILEGNTFKQWQHMQIEDKPTQKVGRIFLLRGCDWSEAAGFSY
eukprot:1185422-Prorocentrum_minimum.AAC.1